MQQNATHPYHIPAIPDGGRWKVAWARTRTHVGSIEDSILTLRPLQIDGWKNDDPAEAKKSCRQLGLIHEKLVDGCPQLAFVRLRATDSRYDDEPLAVPRAVAVAVEDLIEYFYAAIASAARLDPGDDALRHLYYEIRPDPNRSPPGRARTWEEHERWLRLGVQPPGH